MIGEKSERPSRFQRLIFLVYQTHNLILGSCLFFFSGICMLSAQRESCSGAFRCVDLTTYTYGGVMISLSYQVRTTFDENERCPSMDLL